ncbi:MAG: dTDP-4-dehydrorhamnose 3,5-epimerase [Ignavibacteriaceae bacterium]|nr:dTDP-4-dehydrorhamnose 3,5-epimerase [Ignavibacteriaceae bacterium]
MKVIERALNGVILIEPRVFTDSRGYFFETFQVEKYAEIGIECSFVQDNLSRSVKNTIRGMHYQIQPYSQGKLCQVVQGEVLDVALDIRYGSPTYGKHYITNLSESNHRQLWIPPGFAHGFLVLTDVAVFNYKCTKLYNNSSERTILYNDADLAIPWNCESPVLSDKDLLGTRFKDIARDFTFGE